MPILAVDSDAADSIGGQHVFPMAWTVDPTCDSCLDSVSMPRIVSYILGEAALEERYFVISLIEVSMTDRYFAISHGHTMLHRDVMQCLIPGQGRELVTLSELICEIKSTDTPLFGLTSASALSIVVSPCPFIDYALSILNGHLSWGSCRPLGSGLDQLRSVVNCEVLAIRS